MKLISIPALCLSLGFVFVTGCEKFLGVRPDTNKIDLHQVKDLEEILNNSGVSEPNFIVADLVSDDIMIPEQQLKVLQPNSFFTRAYLWESALWGESDTDPMYGKSYSWILQMNMVLSHIGDAEGGAPGQKARVAAQAKIHRAYYYFQLLHIYGPAYNAATAGSDLAVPLILSPDASLKPTRATVREVYQQIVGDLRDAVATDSLPDFGVDVVHPGKAAAHAMLARTYLYAGDYENAQQQADAALAIRSGLLDYNTFIFYSDFVPQAGVYYKPAVLKDHATNPEALFAKVCIDAGFFTAFKNTFFISDDFSEMLGAKDLRFKYQFYKAGNNVRFSYMPYNNNSILCNYTLGVPEMMLIKAEALARGGKGDAAIALLNELRIKRFKPADYAALAYTNDAGALAAVADERRRELFLHGGLRTFDLKRLNREPAFRKELQRVSDQDGRVLATLPAGSPRYQLPFEPKIIANNPGIIQNER